MRLKKAGKTTKKAANGRAPASTAAGAFRRVTPDQWDHARLRGWLARFSKLRIAVVGDVGVDRYVIGAVERISPEAPVPVVRVEEEQLKLGLAANVADNLRALGARALLSGVTGRDRGGEDLRALLRRAGISPTHLVTDRARRTVLKERMVSDRQQLLRVDYETIAPVLPEIGRQVLAHARRMLARADAVILQDYAKGLISPSLATELMRLAARAGKPVAVDPNAKSPPALYRGAFVLTPNTKEAEALAGHRIVDEASLLAAGRRILADTRARHVVITRGKDGMAIFSAGVREVTLIPTYAREVYDVSGAGDTVISVLTLALAAGAGIEEAAILGNLAAGVEVGKRGTATVTAEEIRMAMGLFEAIEG
jgi:rfaE bifunctional protein kinase chain/domain